MGDFEALVPIGVEAILPVAVEQEGGGGIRGVEGFFGFLSGKPIGGGLQAHEMGREAVEHLAGDPGVDLDSIEDGGNAEEMDVGVADGAEKRGCVVYVSSDVGVKPDLEHSQGFPRGGRRSLGAGSGQGARRRRSERNAGERPRDEGDGSDGRRWWKVGGESLFPPVVRKRAVDWQGNDKGDLRSRAG